MRPGLLPARSRGRELRAHVVEEPRVRAERRGDAAGLDLDAVPALDRAVEQRAELRMLQRLASGHHQERGAAELLERWPQLGDVDGPSALGVPGVLRVAPDAADIAALEPHEARRR